MKNKHLLLVILAAFIIIQPFIDILTALTMESSDSSLTVGIILRMVYMALMAAFITYAALHSGRAKLYFAYLAGFAILIIVNFVVNYSVKDPYFLMEELSFYSKTVYFHVLFFGFLLVLEEMKKNGTDTKNQLINYFLIVSLIISSIFVIAQLTGTSIQIYSGVKEGWSGWFSAGNEIGSIMTVLLPITALFAVYRTYKIKDVVKWLPFILLSLSMLALGTKVGYGGIVITLLTVIGGSAIMLVWKNGSEEIKKVKANLIVTIGLLIILVIVTPFTPVFNNMFSHFNILGISFEEKVPYIIDEELTKEQNEVLKKEKKKHDKEQAVTSAQVENLIFSSRENYVEDYKRQFMDAPNSQQLFGMGYAGNYKIEESGLPRFKMIEMDFHDWFYSLGIIGFIYIMGPLIWFPGIYIFKFLVNFKTKFDYFHLLTGVSFLLGIGIAYTAGHVFTAPQVSIYMAFLLAVLIIVDKKQTIKAAK